MSRVLLVDDEAATVEIASLALEQAGFQVTATGDPAAALGLALDREIDVVVLDIQLPGRSGFEVLEELRSHPGTQQIPILFLSVRTDSSDRIEGLRAGADDYLTKPFDPTELTLRVERLVSLRVDRALVGRIESFAVSDLVQHLAETKKSGFLIVGSGRRVGRFVFAEGVLRSASFGQLAGREAALAALEIDAGRFEFVTRSVAAPTPGWQPTEIEVAAVLLETAWLADELGVRQSLLPARTTPLRRTSEDLEPALGAAEAARLPDLPLAEVFAAVGAEPGITVERLVEGLRFAPNRLRLTLVLLIEIGLITTDLPV